MRIFAANGTVQVLCVKRTTHSPLWEINWMIRIPRTVKLDKAIGRGLFRSQRNFLNPIISQIGQYVALVRVNCISHGTTSCPTREIIGQLLEWDFGLAI